MPKHVSQIWVATSELPTSVQGLFVRPRSDKRAQYFSQVPNHGDLFAFIATVFSAAFGVAVIASLPSAFRQSTFDVVGTFIFSAGLFGMSAVSYRMFRAARVVAKRYRSGDWPYGLYLTEDLLVHHPLEKGTQQANVVIPRKVIRSVRHEGRAFHSAGGYSVIAIEYTDTTGAPRRIDLSTQYTQDQQRPIMHEQVVEKIQKWALGS